MAEAEPSQQWRSLFQSEVLNALDCCNSALRHAKRVIDALASPSEALKAHIGDSQSGFTFTRLHSAAENMTNASQVLSDALAYMGTAELLARRGCGPVPAEPVPVASTQRLHDSGKLDEWLALVRLQSAMEHGQDALRELLDYRGRLWTLAYMLGTLPGAPRPSPLAGRASLEGQIRDVAKRLGPVYASTLNMRSLASVAAEAVARIQVS